LQRVVPRGPARRWQPPHLRHSEAAGRCCGLAAVVGSSCGLWAGCCWLLSQATQAAKAKQPRGGNHIGLTAQPAASQSPEQTVLYLLEAQPAIPAHGMPSGSSEQPAKLLLLFASPLGLTAATWDLAQLTCGEVRMKFCSRHSYTQRQQSIFHQKHFDTSSYRL
jgi:hypothetical protein